MVEDFLQFVWQSGFYVNKELCTTSGDRLLIRHPGTWNKLSGPDFSQAVISINGITWVGNVEIHVRATDWNRHLHTRDAAYHNVILHVVYENDAEIQLPNGRVLPCFTLKDEALDAYYLQYERWLSTQAELPCVNSWKKMSSQEVTNWLDVLMNERLSKQCEKAYGWLLKMKGDVLLTELYATAHVFGTPHNSVPMEQLVTRIPWYRVLRRSWTWEEFETWLLHMAGLIESTNEYLNALWNVQPLDTFIWKYGNTRPSSFPTVRVSQWGRWIWLRFIECKVDRGDMLSVLNDDWGNGEMVPIPGRTIKRIWYINLYPALKVLGELNSSKMKALHWKEIPPEQNKVVRSFVGTGVPVMHAGHSQALIELHQEFCRFKKCVNCAVGRYQLKQLRDDRKFEG